MLGLASTVSSGSPVESLYSITLDGTDDKIALGPSDSMILDGFSGITLSLWIKTSTAGGYLFSNLRQSDGSNFSLRFHANSALTGSPLRLEGLILNGSGTLIKPITTADVADGAWHHIVLTGKASEQVLYIDGAVAAGDDATTTGAFGMDASSDVAHIGSFGSGSFFDGQIDEVSIWNSALNLASVQAIYNKGSQYDLTSGLSIGTGPLVAYYRMGNGFFDDKANGVVHDQHASGFGSDLTSAIAWTSHNAGSISTTDGITTVTIGGGSDGADQGAMKEVSSLNLHTNSPTYKITLDAWLPSSGAYASSPTGQWKIYLGGVEATISDLTTTRTTHTVYLRPTDTSDLLIYNTDADDTSGSFHVASATLKKLNGFSGLTSGGPTFTSDIP